MAHNFRELERLETRRLRHINHLIDNGNQGDHRLLVGKENTFFASINGGRISLGPQFEDELNEPLSELVLSLKEDFAAVDLYGFPREVLDDHYFLLTPQSGSNVSWRLYQDPLSAEEYQARLDRKFAKTGLSYRMLEPSDIAELQKLIEGWGTRKKEGVLGSFTRDLHSVRDVEGAIADLQMIQSEIAWLDHMRRSREDYTKEMARPLTRYHGAFKDGKLLAYMSTAGNNSFQVFYSRASVRMNSISPQEFLDLCVARDFVKAGVPLFDRGFLNMREGMIGLIEYKKKFGRLLPKFEYDWSNVAVLSRPENRYLHNLFNP